MALDQHTSSASSAPARWARDRPGGRGGGPSRAFSATPMPARRRAKAQANIGKAMEREVEKGRLEPRRGRRADVAHRLSVGALADDSRALRDVRPRDRGDRRGSRGEAARSSPRSRRSSHARRILATNTSSLSVASIASACDVPERVVGMHFFNPAPVMALVEIVPAIATATRRRSSAPARSCERGGRRRRRVGHAGLHREPRRAPVLRRSASSARGGRCRRRRRSTGR